MKLFKGLIGIFCAVSLLLGIGCSSANNNQGSGNGSTKPETQVQLQTAQPGVTIKVLDVGQGDAILILTDSQTILMDCGDVDEDIQQRLKKMLNKYIPADRKDAATGKLIIDKLILTHPHADHMGGAAMVLNNFAVKEVYHNGISHTPKFYKNFLKAVDANNVKLTTLKAGDILEFGSEKNKVEFKVLSPTPDMVTATKDKKAKHEKVNLNLDSIEGRLTCGSFSMMFTGDGEAETEAGILNRNSRSDLKSNVLKAPHHGSKTSSTDEFLNAVSPEAVVISMGQGNDYHHPHKQVMKRYEQRNFKVYQTEDDEYGRKGLGTVTIQTDGVNYNITGEKEK